MKHIKLFESQKDISDIDDLLLSYVDDGTISNVNVNESSNYYYVYFDFNKNIIGNKKIEKIEEILTRLKRKFTYIKVMKNCLYVYKKNVHVLILGTISKNIKEKLDYVLNGLTIFKKNDRIDFDYYGTNKDNLLFCYSRIRNRVGIKYELYNILEGSYMLDMHDAGSIIIDYFNENYKTNINVNFPHDVTFGRLWFD